jgi:hypothetical protein
MEIDFNTVSLNDHLVIQNPLNIDYDLAVKRYEDFEKDNQLGKLSHTFDPAPDPAGVGYDFGDLDRNVPVKVLAKDFVDDLRNNHGISFTEGFLIALTNNKSDHFTNFEFRGKPGRESIATEYNDAQHSTKKKNFGKWVPDDIPENLGISGYAFRSFLDVSIFEPQISLNEARRLQRLYRQETILAITQDGGVTLI